MNDFLNFDEQSSQDYNNIFQQSQSFVDQSQQPSSSLIQQDIFMNDQQNLDQQQQQILTFNQQQDFEEEEQQHSNNSKKITNKKIQKNKQPNHGVKIDHDCSECPECKEKNYTIAKHCSIYQRKLKARNRQATTIGRQQDKIHQEQNYYYIEYLQKYVILSYGQIIQDQKNIIDRLQQNYQQNNLALPEDILNDLKENKNFINLVNENYEKKKQQYQENFEGYIRIKKNSNSSLKKYFSMLMIFATILCFTTLGGFTDVHNTTPTTAGIDVQLKQGNNVQVERQYFNMETHSQNIQQNSQQRLNLLNFDGQMINQNIAGEGLTVQEPIFQEQQFGNINFQQNVKNQSNKENIDNKQKQNDQKNNQQKQQLNEQKIESQLVEESEFDTLYQEIQEDGEIDQYILQQKPLMGGMF